MRWALAAVLLVGCAQNSVFELTLRMRSAEAVGVPGATEARLDFYPVDTADSGDVLPDELRTISFPLPTDESVERVSVVASGEDIETPLWLSVRYCGGSVPCAFDTPRTWVRFERAFYVGEFTEYELTLPDGGAPQASVPTCDVRGCFPGTTSSGCSIEGIHWCAL